MSDERPILGYARPPRRRPSAVAGTLRAIGAVVCVFGALAGLALVLAGAGAIASAYGPRSTPFYRGHDVCQGGLIVLIGMVMAGFSARWFVFATRRTRGAPTDETSEDRSI
jgi:hypothetical protein